MSYRINGLFSMLLFSIAIILALVAVAQASLWWAGGYVALNLLVTLGVAYSYCAKCACRPHRCSHYFVGKVADFLPKRPQTPYTVGDYAIMLGCASIVFAYPMPWLWPRPAWLIAFCAIGVLGMVLMLFAVCPRCVNTRCPSAGWTRKRKRAQPAESPDTPTTTA